MSANHSGHDEYRVFETIQDSNTLTVLSPAGGRLYRVTEFEDAALRRELSKANTGSMLTLELEQTSDAAGGYQARRPPNGVSITLNPPCHLQDRAGEWQSVTATTM